MRIDVIVDVFLLYFFSMFIIILDLRRQKENELGHSVIYLDSVIIDINIA
jgi:hypothetical protein